MPRTAEGGYSYRSSKTYVHSKGLSCCFRQWRATDSHCQFLHGYALQVKVEFEALELDDRNWVVNFGGLKEFGAWLEETFDHKYLVAKDDPALPIFKELAKHSVHRLLYQTPTELEPLIQLVEVEHTGCEEFARMIYEWLRSWLTRQEHGDKVIVKRVWINEHEANGASYGRAELHGSDAGLHSVIETAARREVERYDSSRRRYSRG